MVRLLDDDPTHDGAHRGAEALAAGRSVLDLRGDGVRDKRAALRDGIRTGVDLIAQAPLRTGRMGGWADLLVRVGDAAEPGGSLATRHRYEQVEIKPDGAGRGFGRLPDPDPADMFFDFEGYPYHEAGAFEYLWGWSVVGAGGDSPRFDYIWCDNEDEERAAYERFVSLLTTRELPRPPVPPRATHRLAEVMSGGS